MGAAAGPQQTPRTLVLSDLHLGDRAGRDVLADPEVRGVLAEHLAGLERLVLLGDVVELRQGPARDALQAAAPALAELTAALPGDAEVVVVPGNHDHRLLSGWLGRRALAAQTPPLGLESEVDWRPDEPLAAVAEALGRRRVRVAYPGVWLSPTTYATHGHYTDRHTTLPILERLGAGVMARIVAEPREGPRRAEDYEATLAPLYAWIDAIAEHGGPVVRGARGGMQARLWQRMAGGVGRRPLRVRLAAAGGFRALVATLNRAGLGPLNPDLSGPELRRAALRSFAEVLSRLGVSAEHAVFGHTHRAGPRPTDHGNEWMGRRTRLLNTGCWIYEPAVLGGNPSNSPYRPGFGALLSGQDPPRLLNLLDGTPPAERLFGPAQG